VVNRQGVATQNEWHLSFQRCVGRHFDFLVHGRMVRSGHGLPKVSPGPAMTALHPVGGPPLKRPYSHIRGGPPARRAACGRLPSLWTPHAIRLCPSLALILFASRRLQQILFKIQSTFGFRFRAGNPLTKKSLLEKSSLESEWRKQAW
jgi:hypothetical protein